MPQRPHGERLTAKNPMSDHAVAYILRELCDRAGVRKGDACPVRFMYTASPDVTGADDVPTIIIRRAADEEWEGLLNASPGSVQLVPLQRLLPRDSEGDQVVPLLFDVIDSRTSASRIHKFGDRSVVIEIDFLAASFFMLSRWEEIVRPTADLHDRFPANASVAFKQRFLQLPIVDLYALVIRRWIQELCPAWIPSRRRFRVELSHDIDQLKTVPSVRGAARMVLGDVVKRHSMPTAIRTVKHVLRERRDPSESPSARGVNTLVNESLRFGHRSTFFWIAAAPGGMNGDYDITEPFARKLIAHIVENGFEVGLHASYETMVEPARLAAECERLRTITPVMGNRQHFLRFRAHDTWRSIENAGMKYDSTLTYADHEGFRCGTCHRFRAYDVGKDRELELWEQPLIVMDVTLRSYRGLTPDDAVARVSQLATTCRDVEGVFTLLWHNTSLEHHWHGWGKAYTEMLQRLASMVERA